MTKISITHFEYVTHFKVLDGDSLRREDRSYLTPDDLVLSQGPFSSESVSYEAALAHYEMNTGRYFELAELIPQLPKEQLAEMRKVIDTAKEDLMLGQAKAQAKAFDPKIWHTFLG